MITHSVVDFKPKKFDLVPQTVFLVRGVVRARDYETVAQCSPETTDLIIYDLYLLTPITPFNTETSTFPHLFPSSLLSSFLPPSLFPHPPLTRGVLSRGWPSVPAGVVPSLRTHPFAPQTQTWRPSPTALDQRMEFKMLPLSLSFRSSLTASLLPSLPPPMKGM